MKKTIFLTIIITIINFTLFGIVQAKRGPAPEVKPVFYRGVKFIASAKMGFIEAWNMETGQKVWEEKVYTVSINPRLEKDVQWVFVTSIAIKEGKLEVVNERGKRFRIDIPQSILNEEEISGVNTRNKFYEFYARLQSYREQPEVKLSSRPFDYNNCDAFRQIVKGGKIFLPWIIQEIKNGDFFLNQAMEEVTGVHIISTAQTKEPIGEQAVSKLWIEWWEKNKNNYKYE